MNLKTLKEIPFMLRVHQPLRMVEIQKALIFNNTIADCDWFRERSITPGEWAADYACLLSVYNVLSFLKPKRILEFGLGQSSKLIHQYAHHKDAYALTVEHDESWISFFQQSLQGTYPINIRRQEIEHIYYKGKKTLVYKAFQTEDVFDFILVDGPFGSSHYSRAQILQMVPQILAQSFCILIDDTMRQGEKQTVKELCSILRQHSIKHVARQIYGSKGHTLICSEDYKFITTTQ